MGEVPTVLADKKERKKKPGTDPGGGYSCIYRSPVNAIVYTPVSAISLCLFPAHRAPFLERDLKGES